MEKDKVSTMRISNGFVWKIINATQAQIIHEQTTLDVYILEDDGSERLIEVDEYIKWSTSNRIFGLEVGSINFDSILNTNQETVTIEPEK